MSKSQIESRRLIESVVGSDYATSDPAFQFDGQPPALLVKPGCADDAAQCLRICSELKLAVIPAGAMTWLDCGNPVTRADVILSLERMNRIVEYSPPDLTATVEAGLTLSMFNRAAERERQWLPFDPPGAMSATLGAIAACNSSGALRLGYGAPRDYCIGLKLAHADGTQSKSGGKVVKNVAGYDMNKLYVGSFGTLAVLTEVTFKLRPMPENIVTAAITAKKPKSLSDLARLVSASDLQPASIVLTNIGLNDIFGPEHEFDSLLLRFADSEAAVEHQLKWIADNSKEDYRTAFLRNGQDALLWAKIAEIDGESTFAVKISMPLSKALAAYDKAAGHSVVTADLGTGTIRVAWDGIDEAAVSRIEQLRAGAQAEGGTLFVERAPATVKRQLDAWGDVGATASLMRSIKAKFDPQSLLNPGRFVAGI